MYGDFSRVLDARASHYSAVLAQQGRLLLDAELNEQTAIVLDYLRRLTTDLVGPFAGPAHRAGFNVGPVVGQGQLRAVKLSHGYYYVYGICCEAHPPGESDETEIALDDPHADEAPFVVYLVVWEQTVGAISAPELVEPALGLSAPDTARRLQVCWRAHASRQLPGTDADLTELKPEKIVEAFHEHNADHKRRPLLGARAHAGSSPAEGPLTAPTAAAYRGVENQLYRTEIHLGGSGEQATFKWSRDNGSVELALSGLTDNDAQSRRTATLRLAWRDARGGLEVGDWVELVDDRSAPFGATAPLMRVQEISLAKREVVLEDSHAREEFHARLHPFLRRWDHDLDGAQAGQGIPVKHALGRWFELEDGVQVWFEPHDDHLYQPGDFWLTPARTATRDVLWPRSEDQNPQPRALPPHGPTRYRAPLALVTAFDATTIDLRTQFGPNFHDPEEDDADIPPVLTTDVADQGAMTVIRAPVVLHQLHSISTFASGAVFDVPEGTSTIGRERSRDIQLEHPDVSRHHATIKASGENITIEDNDSSNGTRVNGGEKIVAPTKLEPDDVITLGPEDVKLQVKPAPASDPPEPEG